MATIEPSMPGANPRQPENPTASEQSMPEHDGDHSDIEHDDTEHKVTDMISSRAHEAINQLSATAADLEARLRRAAGETEDRVRERATAAQHRGEDVRDEARTYVEEHPLQALGIALFAGFVLHAMLRR